MQSGKKSKKLNFMQKIIVTFKEVRKNFTYYSNSFAFLKVFKLLSICQVSRQYQCSILKIN